MPALDATPARGFAIHRVLADLPLVFIPSLETSLREIPGAGAARAAQLAKLQLMTVGDLLLHRPHRYEDRRHVVAIRDLQLGEGATTRGCNLCLTRNVSGSLRRIPNRC